MRIISASLLLRSLVSNDAHNHQLSNVQQNGFKVLIFFREGVSSVGNHSTSTMRDVHAISREFVQVIKNHSEVSGPDLSSIVDRN